MQYSPIIMDARREGLKKGIVLNRQEGIALGEVRGRHKGLQQGAYKTSWKRQN